MSKTGLQMFRIRDTMESIGQKIVKNILSFMHGVDVTPPQLHLDRAKWHF